MVKKSFFARLFGRSEATKFQEPEEIIPRRVAEGRASEKRGAPAPKSRMPDIDFDEPAPRKKPNGAPAAEKPAAAPTMKSAPKDSMSVPKDAMKEKSNTDASPTKKVDAVLDASHSNHASGNGSSTTPTVAEKPHGAESIPLDATPPTMAAAVKATEMSRNEEMALKLQEGFTGLSSVLRGIDTKIDQQQRTSEELIVSVKKIPEIMKDMPDASRAGLELLNTISGILEYQGRTTGELLAKMRELPGNLESMEQRFQEQVNQIARASHDSERVTKETQQRLTSAFDGVKRAVEDVQIHASRRQDSLVEELKRTQAQQEARVDELLKRMGNSTRVVVFLMVAVVVALLVAVYGMQR